MDNQNGHQLITLTPNSKFPQDAGQRLRGVRQAVSET